MNNIDVNKSNFKRLLITIQVSTVILLTMGCNSSTINKQSSNNINNTSSEEFLNNFNKIYNNNVTLVKEWESIYPMIRNYISNYGEYLDQQGLIENLDKLQFEIVNDIESDAYTDFENNKIVYNKSLFEKDESIVNSVILHEAIHYLLQESFSSSNRSGIGLALDEGNATILTTELSNGFDTSFYDKNALYVKTLCELLDSDTYQRITAEHDYDELLEALGELSSKSDAKKLVKLIDKSCLEHYKTNTEEDQKAWEIINKMYENKNNISIEESNDLIMKCYSNELINTKYTIPKARYPHQAYVIKNYFINKEVEPRIDLKDGENLYDTIILDEKNEVIDKLSQNTNTKKV